MSRYQVKWTGAYGVVNYGIYEGDGGRGVRKPQAGHAFVSDPILPVLHEVPEKDLVDIKVEFDGEYDRHIEKAYRGAEKRSIDLGDGLKVNKLFRTPVADGYAYYVVTKVTAKTATVEWRGFCADRWTDSVLGWGGSFPKRTIEELVGREDGIRRIFGRKAVV